MRSRLDGSSEGGCKEEETVLASLLDLAFQLSLALACHSDLNFASRLQVENSSS